MLKLANVSFGGTSAIVTSTALIVGFSATAASVPPMIAGLLILGVADNITDSLSIHVYQESERLKARPAFPATLSNFATRLAISLTFVLLVLSLPAAYALYPSIAWGLSLLTGLTWLVARQRGASVAREVCKHVAAAVLAVAVSRAIGMLILAYFH